MADYSSICKEPLKLKGLPLKKKKKKKNGDEMKKNLEKSLKSEAAASSTTNGDSEADKEAWLSQSDDGVQLTKAQAAFFKKQEKIEMERVMEKASKTHRQMVEEFNRKLDEMTEHYDIPKVSWTK